MTDDPHADALEEIAAIRRRLADIEARATDTAKGWNDQLRRVAGKDRFDGHATLDEFIRNHKADRRVTIEAPAKPKKETPE